jgi:hypothetical protein
MTTCKQALQNKIRINMKEYENPKQAIAVSYSQILKSKPHCKPHLKRKTPIKKSVCKSSVKKSRVVKKSPLKKTSVKKSVRKSPVKKSPVKKSIRKQIRRR